jgi:nicotinamidase-related amidase
MTIARKFVDGHYPWPFDGDLRPENTALMIIDVQIAHCRTPMSIHPEGTGRSFVVRLLQMLNRARQNSLQILFTRKGYRPDLSDLGRNERWRSQRRAEATGTGVLLRGHPDWHILRELAPHTGEPIIDKPGMSAFYATDLEQLLRRSAIRNLVITGLFTDGSVQATLRDANDRGYECLLLEDCCAATEPENHHSTVRMLRLLCGLYGSVSRSDQLLECLR